MGALTIYTNIHIDIYVPLHIMSKMLSVTFGILERVDQVAGH